MSQAIKSLIATGTKLWVDSIDPELVIKNFQDGATGATSNPIIIADLLKSGRFDQEIKALIGEGLDDAELAWAMTDRMVSRAETVFLPVYERTKGNDGYVSFELDPLLEDVEMGPPVEERTQRYLTLAKEWAAHHPNRLIKVPATQGGLAALEEMVAAGVNVNVTLIFSQDQYRAARDACWKGAQKRSSFEKFKSVYSIFVSRLDIYTETHCQDLSPSAQGMVGIVNAKRVWRQNKEFWADKRLPLDQEIIFASTGTKKPEDPKDKYVAAFAGSDIQTNPPATNAAVAEMGKTYDAQISDLPPSDIMSKYFEMMS